MENKAKTFLLGSIPFVLILAVWTLFSVFGVVPNWLIPNPYEVLIAFWNLLIDGTIFRLLVISAYNVVPAFVLALLIALVLGIWIGLNRTIEKIFMPFLSAIYIIPSLAWLPLIILFLGFTRETIWCLIFISCFMKMIYNVINGVKNVNPKYILVAENYAYDKFDIILKVILPSALPQIITGIRMGFGSSWRSLISAEMLVTMLGGIGKFIWLAQWSLSFDKVFVGIIVIALIGIIFETMILKRIENHIYDSRGLTKN